MVEPVVVALLVAGCSSVGFAAETKKINLAILSRDAASHISS